MGRFLEVELGITSIEWTDYTFNGWIGCSKVHEGCAHCYAEADMDHRRGRVKWGPKGTRSRTSDDYWRQPLKWHRDAEKAGERRRVFCASLADVFEEWDGPIINHKGQQLFVCDYPGCYAGGFQGHFDYIPATGLNCPRCALCLRETQVVTIAMLRRDLFSLIGRTPHLDWLLLTKRPENIRQMWPTEEVEEKPKDWTPDDIEIYRRSQLCRLKNVWVGTSVSNQATASRMIPELLRCRRVAAVLFVSAEPLLGPIDFTMLTGQYLLEPSLPKIGWVIVGGESGNEARLCIIDWIKDIVRQCQGAGVPCFVKQIGSCPANGKGVPHPIRDAKGGDLQEWPEDLRVREFPELTEERESYL